MSHLLEGVVAPNGISVSLKSRLSRNVMVVEVLGDDGYFPITITSSIYDGYNPITVTSIPELLTPNLINPNKGILKELNSAFLDLSENRSVGYSVDYNPESQRVIKKIVFEHLSIVGYSLQVEMSWVLE